MHGYIYCHIQSNFDLSYFFSTLYNLALVFSFVRKKIKHSDVFYESFGTHLPQPLLELIIYITTSSISVSLIFHMVKLRRSLSHICHIIALPKAE